MRNQALTVRFIIGLVLAFTLSRSLLARTEEGQQIMIAGPSAYAVEIGKDIARKGGNVIDVAVAVNLTLAVTAPYFGSLGGGGFALVKMGPKVEVLDFRETAPQATNKKFYTERPKQASSDGGTAIGVPGIPAGLWELHKKYGKLHWSRLFYRPIQLATQGFEVSAEWAETTAAHRDRFNSGGKRAFFKRDGKNYLPGDTLKQPDLAKALKQMSVRGVQPFYRDEVARDIVESVRKSGGVMTLQDLRNYKVRWLTPLYW